MGRGRARRHGWHGGPRDAGAHRLGLWVHGLASLWNEGSLRKKTGSSSIEPLLERSATFFSRLLANAIKPQRRSR
ncbi:hypothetical protein VZL07_09805 [Pseudomyxococcus flavus]